MKFNPTDRTIVSTDEKGLPVCLAQVFYVPSFSVERNINNGHLMAASELLSDALLDALPFVEDAVSDDSYKKIEVQKVLNKILKALEQARAY